MDEESNENQDSTNTDETDTQSRDDAGGDDVQPDTEDVEQLKTTNQKLYARAKKAEAENKELKAKVPNEQVPLNPNPSLKTDDERFERLDLKTDGYSGDEVDFIMQNGGRKALANSYVKEAIASARRKAKSED